jgi:hypothetical protein
MQTAVVQVVSGLKNMMSSPDDGIHHEDRDRTPQRGILPIAGYHTTNYHGSQASVPLNAHHETGRIDRSLIVLDHGCSQSLMYPLHNVHADLHHASTMVHAHGGVSRLREWDSISCRI